MGDLNKIATTGFSKMSDRQAGVWDVGSLSSVKNLNVDQSSGVLMPFWSDNNLLFLAGKGDGNIRYYEWESDSLYALSEHKSTDPQRGMCFLPRRALAVSECEIARAFKVYGSVIEPIAFIVPRKADSFQSDIFPPAPSSEPSLSASEFFAGKDAPRNVVSLDTGKSTPAPEAVSTSFSVPAPAPAVPTPQSTTAPTPTRTFSAEEASPAPSPSIRVSEPAYAQETAAEARSPPSRQQSTGAGDAALREENTRLTTELREAREKIRNLELQVESIKANAKKAVALLDG
jgi:coronin-1B/1C/6